MPQLIKQISNHEMFTDGNRKTDAIHFKMPIFHYSCATAVCKLIDRENAAGNCMEQTKKCIPRIYESLMSFKVHVHDYNLALLTGNKQKKKEIHKQQQNQ